MQCICKKCEKYGFSRDMISAGFFLCVCVYWIAKFKTEEGKLHSMAIISLYGFYCGWL